MTNLIIELVMQNTTKPKLDFNKQFEGQGQNFKSLTNKI
jgi:hypothetical protein